MTLSSKHVTPSGRSSSPFRSPSLAPREPALTQNLREREQLKLGALLQALGRMERGDYGLCTECGREIPLDRLLVFPETATCMSCSA